MPLTSNQKELVFTVAKEIILKAIESKLPLGISSRGGEEAANDLGDRFAVLVSKTASALKTLDH